MPKVSVVLPTYNRLARLKRVCAGLEQQNYPMDDFEVIIVSDGSTDGTNEYLQSMKTCLKVKPVIQKNGGPAAARNAGIANATGDIIVFIDDDVVPIPQFISEHIRIHEASPVEVAVVGPMLTPPDARLAPWVRWGQDRLAEQYDDMVQERWKPVARQFYTGNASMSRRLLEQSGGFDANFHRAEDVELAYRLEQQGLTFLFNPKAIGYHYEERSFPSWVNIPYSYGRFDVVFAHQKNQTWLLPKIYQEYYTRHPLIRTIIEQCLDHRRLSQGIVSGFRFVTELSDRLGLNLLQRASCSIIFNLYYYQGVADELGGKAVFLSALQSKKTQPLNRVDNHELF